MDIFDIIIIGKGLIGSAATKYLSSSGQKIAIIGADEPIDMMNATVYASHYDQGRLQRTVGRDAVWTRLNIESANAYHSLQNETGIRFHYDVGCLYVSLNEHDAYLSRLPQLANEFNFPYQLFQSGNELKKSFPDFVFPSIAKGNLESTPSGHINPRKLIEAQLAVCKKNNATVISDTVISVEKNNGHINITTEKGNKYISKKVLLAPGAFANFLQLTKQKLALTLKSETIVLAKVSETEAKRLSALPSLLYEIETKNLEEIYLIRPIQYPDGNWYLKMGCNLSTDIFFHSLEEIQQWFKEGNSDNNLPVLKDALQTLMPALQVEDYFTKRCVITRTKHGRQYIGKIDEGAYIATGGNGYSAMCSDAVGKIAAHNAFNDSFPEPYKAEDFMPVYGD